MAEDEEKEANSPEDFLSIDETVDDSAESLGARMQPGIHDNVILESIKYVTPAIDGKESWKGNAQEGFDITYRATQKSMLKDENGNLIKEDGTPKVISREGSVAKKREFFDPSSEAKMTHMRQRVKHIMTKFVEPEKAIAKGKTLEEFVNNIWSIIEEPAKTTKLSLKVIRGSQGYGEVPGYRPFLSRMDSKTANRLTCSKKELEGEKPSTPDDLAADMDQEISLPGMND